MRGGQLSTPEAPETTRAVLGTEPLPVDVLFGIASDLAKAMTGARQIWLRG